MTLFKVQNKYTNAIYDVLAFDNVKRKVTLRRPDNTVFSIDISEYRCYYIDTLKLRRLKVYMN